MNVRFCQRAHNSDRSSAVTQRLTDEAGTDFVPAHPYVYVWIYISGSDYQ